MPPGGVEGMEIVMKVGGGFIGISGDEFVKFMMGDCPLAIKLKIIMALPKPSFVRAALGSVFQ